MPEFSRYGSIETVGGTGAMTADGLVGQRGGNVGQLPGASLSMDSTAPYKRPKTLTEKARESRGRAETMCVEPECLAHAIEGGYCMGHSSKLGVVPESKACQQDGCRGLKQRGRDYCRWHGW